MPLRSILGWTALALLGLALAAGVTLAASELSSQKIGLQSEPLDAGRNLAPPDQPGENRTGQGAGSTTDSDGTGGAGGGGSNTFNTDPGTSGTGSGGGGSDSSSGGGSDSSSEESGGQPNPGGREPDSDD